MAIAFFAVCAQLQCTSNLKPLNGQKKGGGMEMALSCPALNNLCLWLLVNTVNSKVVGIFDKQEGIAIAWCLQEVLITSWRN